MKLQEQTKKNKSDEARLIVEEVRLYDLTFESDMPN